MKKLGIIFVLCFVFSNVLFAENIFIGAKLGPGAVYALGKDSDDLDAAFGMAAGVFGMYRLMDYFAIQAELMYEMKGYGSTSTAQDGSKQTNRLTLNYFSVPVIAKGVFDVSPVLIQPYAGLNFSFLMSADISASAGGYDISIDATDQCSLFDLGVIGGAEFYFEVMDHLYITADVRLEFGFLTTVDHVDAPNAVIPKIYNSAFYALVGAAYQF